MIEHVIVEYGGNSHDANIYCASASPTITNCTIRYSSGTGTHLESSSPTIEGNLISDNGQDGINGDGGSSPTVKSNTISNNGGIAVYVRPNHVNRIIGNSGAGNGENVIKVRGGEITDSGAWVKQDFPYVVTGDITVRHSSATDYNTQTTALLTIEPGVVVRFEPGTGLYIGLNNTSSSIYDYYGALSAQGTADLPVVFTSNSPTPAPGDWKGIYFSNFTHDSSSVIEHVIVEYGGNSHDANIYCASASPTITNSTIRNSGFRGIYVDGGSSPFISGNFITGNNDSPINVHALRVYRLNGNSGSDNGKDYIEVRGARDHVKLYLDTTGFSLCGHRRHNGSVFERNPLQYTNGGGIDHRAWSGGSV